MSTRLSQIVKGGIKMPCACATTANITLSGLQTIDGYVTLEGDRVLVKNQTTTTENGIYVASATAWTRATDWNAENDAINGMLVLDANDSTAVYRVTFSGTFVLGTTVCTFTDINSAFVADATAQAVAAAASAAAALVSENNAETAETNAETAETNAETAATNAAASAVTAAAAAAVAIAKNGTVNPTANLPMAGFRHTGCQDGVAATDYATKGQLDTAFSTFNAMGLEWKTGLLCTNNSGTPLKKIDISAGRIMDTFDTYMLTNSASFTKDMNSTWAAGTGNGGISDDDGGTLANSTQYGLWMLGKSTDSTAKDFIGATTRARSLSDSAATAAGFDISRLVWCFKTDGSANILPSVDGGDGWNVWKTAQSTAALSESAAGALQAIECPPFMIADLQMIFFTNATSTGNYSYYGLVNSESQDNPTLGTTSHVVAGFTDASSENFVFSGDAIVKVNASREVRHKEAKAVISGAGAAAFNGIYINVRAWKFLPTVTDLV